MAYKDSSPEEKALAAARQREWRAKNPEKWKAIVGPSRAKWRAKNYSMDLECQRVHRYRVRQEIFELLGGARCVHCGYDKDWRCLQIDHIHGGGKKDSRTSGGTTNLWSFRRWLSAHQEDAKHVYQVLCANCNWIKRFENGEQPGGPVDKLRNQANGK